MRKGVVVIRPPAATAEIQSQIAEILRAADWVVENRRRFDGVLIVAFERMEDAPDETPETMDQTIRTSAFLADLPFEIKQQE